MGVEIGNLNEWPIDPADSLTTMRQIREAIMRLQRQVADNFTPNPNIVQPPWVSLRYIRLTTYTRYGANWYGGRIQKRTDTALDPTTDYTATDYWEDINSSSDDCYVVDVSANKLPASTHLNCLDSTVYVWGHFLDYAGAKVANSSTNAPAVSRLPVFQTFGIFLVPVLVKITGSATRSGVYTARLWKVNGLSAMDTTSGSNLANTDFGSDPGTNNCYAFNTREVGTAGHSLSTGGTPNLVPGYIVGRAAADNKVCVFIDECQ